MQIRSSAGVFHDHTRFACAYWASGHGYDFEFEPKGEFTEDKIVPDLKLTRKPGVRDRKIVVYVEIQLDTKRAWTEKTQDAYQGRELVIIDLVKAENALVDKTGPAVFKHLLRHVGLQLDNFTQTKFTPNKVRDGGNYYIMLEDGTRCKAKNAWKYEKRIEYNENPVEDLRKSGPQRKKDKLFPTPRGSKGGVGMCGGTGAREMASDLQAEGRITEEERKSMQSGSGGQLNPEWVGWLMGFPPGWTDIEE